MRFDLPHLAEHCGAQLRLATVGSVNDEKRRAWIHDGQELDYDHLAIATGTRLALSDVVGHQPAEVAERVLAARRRALNGTPGDQRG